MDEFIISFLGLVVGFAIAKFAIDMFLGLNDKNENSEHKLTERLVSNSRECDLHNWKYNAARQLSCAKCGKRPT